MESSPSAAELSNTELEAFVEQYGSSILTVARRYSASAQDADDVYQHTVEMVMTKSPTDDFDRLAAWARSVAHNAALDIHRLRSRELPTLLEEHLELVSGDIGPGERVEIAERDGHMRSAMSRLRPDQARCLLLRAEDLGYPEISRVTGFSYAKVNRCLSEGRKELLDRYRRIDSGSECQRLLGALSRFADGECDPERTRDIESHLAVCLGCQYRLREFRAAPKSAAAAFPVAAVDAVDSSLAEQITVPFRKLADYANSLAASVQQQFAGKYVAIQTAAELATAKNAAIAVGLSASLVAGGVGVAEVARNADERATTSDGPAVAPIAPPSDTQSQPAVTDATSRPEPVQDKEPTREPTAADVEKPQREAAPEDDGRSTYQPPAGQSAPPVDDFQAPSGSGDSGDGAGSVPGVAP